MEVVFDFDKLNVLLKSFYDISGLRYSVLDSEYNVVFASSSASNFCAQINATPDGHKRCMQCDAQSAKNISKNTKKCIYRCHAGVTEAIIPVIGQGEIVAYLIFGQILSDDISVNTQWKKAKECLNWYNDVDSLENSFKDLTVLTNQKIDACSNLLSACSSYIWLEGMVKTSSLTDIQRLYNYIGINYKNKITLDSISERLSISKTKLCMLAKKNNTTIMNIIRDKRISAAKNLLENSDLAISDIASQVGIDDYNYFSKVFKSLEKITPRNYRKQFRKKSTDELK